MIKDDAPVTLLEGFLASMSLLTRLPLPALRPKAYAAAPEMVWAYPLVGALLGGMAALAGLFAIALGLPPNIAAGIALAVYMLVTGAMHEDGLADTCDGFWGATERARRLEIMKDSQIGTYGVLGLIISVGLRWIAVAGLLVTAPAALIAAAALSRSLLPMVMATTPHARDSGLSHSVGQPTPAMAALALLAGLLVALLCGGSVAFGALVLAGLAVAALRLVAFRKIGGQTGDVLGASQQLGEAAVLVVFLVASI